MKRMTELMDNPVPFEDYMTFSEYKASFTIESVEYLFNAENDIDDWYIYFEAYTENEAGMTGITGTGNEFTVFATIADIMRKFIAHYDPKKFIFSAKEKSRIKLYQIFAQKIAKDWNYTVSTIDDLQTTNFTFVKE